MKTEKPKFEPWKHVPKSEATKAKISASMRGNVNARGKRLPPDKHRVAVRITFAPAVFAALENHLAKHGGKRSFFVSDAVAAALGIAVPASAAKP